MKETKGERREKRRKNAEKMKVSGKSVRLLAKIVGEKPAKKGEESGL